MARPRRIPGFDYLGPHQYFLTFCTHKRGRTFEDECEVESALTEVRRAATATQFALLAYCVMPDHVHLLVEGVDAASDLRAFATSAKKLSGIAYSQRRGCSLWQEGYYDRVLREGDNVRAIVRYMLENPVRAGLVRSPTDYPHLGSDRWPLDQLIAGS